VGQRKLERNDYEKKTKGVGNLGEPTLGKGGEGRRKNTLVINRFDIGKTRPQSGSRRRATPHVGEKC